MHAARTREQILLLTELLASLLPLLRTRYAPYQRVRKLQPYYRKYRSRHAHGLNPEKGGGHVTLFRDVDRIRLTTTIIGRHINLSALSHSFQGHKLVKVRWFPRPVGVAPPLVCCRSSPPNAFSLRMLGE